MAKKVDWHPTAWALAPNMPQPFNVHQLQEALNKAGWVVDIKNLGQFLSCYREKGCFKNNVKRGHQWKFVKAPHAMVIPVLPKNPMPRGQEKIKPVDPFKEYDKEFDKEFGKPIVMAATTHTPEQTITRQEVNELKKRIKVLEYMVEGIIDDMPNK